MAAPGRSDDARPSCTARDSPTRMTSSQPIITINPTTTLGIDRRRTIVTNVCSATTALQIQVPTSPARRVTAGHVGRQLELNFMHGARINGAP